MKRNRIINSINSNTRIIKDGSFKLSHLLYGGNNYDLNWYYGKNSLYNKKIKFF